MVVEAFGLFLVDELGAVGEVDNCFFLSEGCHIVDVVDRYKSLFGNHETDQAVFEVAHAPGLVHHELLVLVVFEMAVAVAFSVVAFANKLLVVVIFHQTSFDATMHIGGSDVAFLSQALPPAAVTVVVAPIAYFGGVAVGGERNLDAVSDTHFIGGYFK